MDPNLKNILNISEDFEKKILNGKYVPTKYEVEVDKEGYTKSFSLNELDKAKEFFDEYGFLVVNDVITKKECEKTIDEIWETVKKKIM